MLVVIGAVLILMYTQQEPDKLAVTTTTITTLPETTTVPETTTTTAPVATTSIKGECAVDSHCTTAGNFSHICLPGDSKFEDDKEWKPEYKCLEKTTCSCMDGKCEWNDTYDYGECMAKLSINYCRWDSDCVPEQCCHPNSCINKEFEQDCSGTACTEECRQGTMDCGCGTSVCIEHKCMVLWKNDMRCGVVHAL